MTACLLTLDWGTTNLRAVLFDASGETLQVRSAELGILRVRDGDFEQALMSLCGDWLKDGTLPVIASGMIGSRQGWAEAPYLPAPASAESASSSLMAVPLRTGGTLWLIAGVRCLSPAGIDDVMRGEEAQLWGADLPEGATAILPGTHSKWVRCGAAGSIETFRTWMTGELYSVLCTHSILGRLMQPGDDSPDSFDLGVRRALKEPAAIGALLFSVRAAGLMSRLEPAALPDYLSGLLIGAEVAAGMGEFLQRQDASDHGVHLIGEPALCQRYARAMAIAGIETALLDTGLAARGAWRIARAAGLLKSGTR